MSKNIDSQLIKEIKKICDPSMSLIEEVSFVLDVNYDAAYRRLNNMTAISLSDAVKLSKHFNISLNELYQKNNQNLLISKSQDIHNFEELEGYFKKIVRDLKPLNRTQNSSILYCAKDLPMGYELQNTLLLRFKIFVWMYVFDENFAIKNISFHDFIIPPSLIKAALGAGKAYDNIKITEVWNYGILNGIINQVSYFFEVKLLTYKDAMTICEDLFNIIKSIEIATQLGYRGENKIKFQLYHNELLNMNNNILIKHKNKKRLYSSYSMLKYYLTDDRKTCDEFDEFMTNQINMSTLLTETGIKERIMFFKPKYQRITKLKERIELIRQFPLH